MITPFEVYLIGNMDSICGFFGVLWGVSFLFMMFSFVCYYAADEDKVKNNAKRDFSFLTVFFILFCFIECILPSSKTMASMLIIPNVVNSVYNNVDVKKINNEILFLLNSYSKDDKKNS